jgi:hypothetical protein
MRDFQCCQPDQVGRHEYTAFGPPKGLCKGIRDGALTKAARRKRESAAKPSFASVPQLFTAGRSPG